MKVIIAGSRDETVTHSVMERIVHESGFQVSEVVCGMARGVDTAGADWARRSGVPVREMPADWTTYGRSAGPKRNAAMADYADALIAVWDGRSRGTEHMIAAATKKGLPIHLHRLDGPRQHYGFDFADKELGEPRLFEAARVKRTVERGKILGEEDDV